MSVPLVSAGKAGPGEGEERGEKLVHNVGSTLVSNPQEFQEDSLEFASDIAGLLIHLYGWVCSGSGPCAT